MMKTRNISASRFLDTVMVQKEVNKGIYYENVGAVNGAQKPLNELIDTQIRFTDKMRYFQKIYINALEENEGLERSEKTRKKLVVPRLCELKHERLRTFRREFVTFARHVLNKQEYELLRHSLVRHSVREMFDAHYGKKNINN